MRRLASLALSLVVAATSASAQSVPEIVVSGSGVVVIKPDRATLTIAVVNKAPSAADAGRQNSAQIIPVIAVLKRLGIPDTAIVTSGYSVALEREIYPRMPGTAEGPPTYVARNGLQVMITDLDRIGQLVDSALAAGATEASNVFFDSSKRTEARERAIAAAISSARASAAASAAAAGGSLGPIIEIAVDQPGVGGYGIVERGTVGASAIVMSPIMPTDIRVQVQARLRFQFVPR